MVGKEQLSWATECHYRSKSGVKSMHEERASEHSSSQGTDMGLSQGLALTAALATADCTLGPPDRHFQSLTLQLTGLKDIYLKTNGPFSGGLSSHSTSE